MWKMCAKTRSRRIFHVLAGQSALVLAAYVIGSAAMAVPIPSASTASELNLSVSLSGVQVKLPLFSHSETSAQTATSATGLDPLGDLSVHFATADSASTIQPAQGLTPGGNYSGSGPVFNINMRHETLAQSMWSGPMGARASASGSAGFSDLTVTAMPGATLNLDWIFEELRLDAAPRASLSTIQHMVSISLESPATEWSGPSIFQAGFSATARDGETRWTAYDLPGSTAISDWLDAVSAGGTGPSDYPLTGPTLALSLDSVGSSAPALPRELVLGIDVSHMEYSSEAPLAPVRPVGERTGAEDTGAMTHWDAEQLSLSFDHLPLNIFLDAGGSPMNENQDRDPLATAHLEIDPLVFVGDFDKEGHFVGTGDVRLVAADGEILFQTPLPGLVYDERLYELEGFNLFGPLLGPTSVASSDSRWLMAFYERMYGKDFYLPELFIDIGLPAESGAQGNRWSSDFSTPANATLSFAGPALVAVPDSAMLLLIGLFSLILYMPIYRVRSGAISSR